MTSTTGLTARKFITKNYDKSTLNDIAQYGCITGCATGFIYNHDILNFFHAHQDEIECELEDRMGEDYLSQLMRGDDIDFDTLAIRATWTFVEIVAEDKVLSEVA